MNNAFITGANRGLGLELTRQLLERGAGVVATCRRPADAKELQELAARYQEKLLILPMDVTDDAQVRAASLVVAQKFAALDLLINNAGIYPRGERVDGFDAAQMLRVFDVNVAGPLRAVSHLAPPLRRGTQPRIVNISSQLGSLTRMDSNWGDYSYNSSKAALNMVTRKLAHDLRKDGIAVIAVHPGWVQTDMGGASAAVTAADSARGILAVAAKVSLADTGKFFVYSGQEHPW